MAVIIFLFFLLFIIYHIIGEWRYAYYLHCLLTVVELSQRMSSPACTGWTFENVCNTSNTGPAVLRQPRTSPVDSDYALPVVTNFLCRISNSAHLVVGPSLSLDLRLGIRCRLTSVIRRVVREESFRRSLKTWWLISATLCGWGRCFVADQLW